MGAMTFGSVLPNGKLAFPTSPTWMTYAGDDSQCMDNVPVLISQNTFCQVFTAEARVFRYNLVLIPANKQMSLWDSNCHTHLARKSMPEIFI